MGTGGGRQRHCVHPRTALICKLSAARIRSWILATFEAPPGMPAASTPASSSAVREDQMFSGTLQPRGTAGSPPSSWSRVSWGTTMSLASGIGSSPSSFRASTHGLIVELVEPVEARLEKKKQGGGIKRRLEGVLSKPGRCFHFDALNHPTPTPRQKGRRSPRLPPPNRKYPKNRPA